MVIAIDGPAGSGKSTIAKMLAEKLKDREGNSFNYINSGKIYRALTFGCLREGIDPVDAPKVTAFAQKANVKYHNDRVIFNNEDITEMLHTDEIDRFSAPLSAIVPVRRIVNDFIRKISNEINVVVEGRDMTTIVFPKAEFRFYLDASVESRAKRRFLQGVSQLSLEDIKKAIIERDEIDKNKEEGSLFLGDNVIFIDTSGLTINQVYGKLEEIIMLDNQGQG